MIDPILYLQCVHPVATETFVSAEISELHRRCYQVQVIAQEVRRELLADCIYGDKVWGGNSSTPALIEEVDRQVALLSPRYIHTHFLTDAAKLTVQVAERHNIPFGFTCHAYDIWYRGYRVEPEQVNMIGRHPLCVTCAVEGSKHREFLLWCGVPEEKIIITPNSVDREKLPPARTEAPRSITKMLAVGRPVEKKGFLTAIDAARLLRISGHPVELEIIGGADADKPYGQAVSDYARHFSFVSATPMLPHAQVLERIRDADVLLMPSMITALGDSDGIPTVLTEAMLLRTPVVSTDVGSITDLVIDGDTGFIARAGDPASLAAKIAQLIALSGDHDRFESFLQVAGTHAKRSEITASCNTLVGHLHKIL